MSKKKSNKSDHSTVQKTVEQLHTQPPLVFVSHDSRDAALADAFSRLIQDASAGVLPSYMSSDRKPGGGIAFGAEWFDDIMGKLNQATDVVALLTERSVGRPWILFESGVARGKLGVPVIGLALGISLDKAAIGPFAQFQNCIADEEQLMKLLRQLLSRTTASPREDTLRQYVREFLNSVAKHTGTSSEPDSSPSEYNRVAALFEEVKVLVGGINIQLARLNNAPRFSSWGVNTSTRFSSADRLDYIPAKAEEIAAGVRHTFGPNFSLTVIAREMVAATRDGNFAQARMLCNKMASRLDPTRSTAARIRMFKNPEALRLLHVAACIPGGPGSGSRWP